jgi:hypothetical protein
VENHAGEADFYFRVLSNYLGAPMLAVIILLIVFWLADRLTRRKRPPLDGTFIVIFSAMAVMPLIIFTVPQTKIAWYIYPSFIGLCFMAGYAAQSTVDALLTQKNKNHAFFFLAACAAALVFSGINRPFEGSASRLTTNITSAGNIFSQAELKPGEKYIIVNSNGGASGRRILISWLLDAYYAGLEYQPYGMERYGDEKDTLAALCYTDEEDLNSFLSAYPGMEILSRAVDYTGNKWGLLRRLSP